MRLNILLMALLVAAGIGVSLLLVPRGKELALQNFRDRDYSEAAEAYRSRYAAGDRSPDTLMPLAGLAMDQGDIATALSYLEEFVAGNPDQLDARETLGRLYQSDERMGDYLANLEHIVLAKPDYERTYELFSYYRFFGWHDREIAALRRLVAIRPNELDNVFLLARSLASTGNVDEARRILADLDDRLTGKVDGDVRELLTALLLADGKVDEAFQRADRWLTDKSPSGDVLELVNQMVAAGRADLAYRLIKPYEARAAADEAIALAMVDLETALGRLDEARLRLSAWAARGRIPGGSLGRFIGLATNAGLQQLALQTAHDRDLKLIPDWALVGLAETAFKTKDRAFLDRMVNELGDSFLNDRPVLAGEIALARDDKAGARRWAGETLADPHMPLIDHISAVRQLVRADAPAQATAAFDRLHLAGALPDDVLSELGTLFIDLDRVQRGFAWFAERRRARPTPAVDVGWARLCARAGQPDDVIAWLDRTPQVEGWILQDIASSANDRVFAAQTKGTSDAAAARLGLKAAERAYALTASPANATALAGAYLANQRAADALALIRPLLGDGGAVIEGLYAQALEALGMVEELAAFWTAKLATGMLSVQDADSVLYAMLGNKTYKAALPYLKARAETRGGDWVAAYAEAARGVGGAAVDELADFLDRDIARAEIGDAIREQRLYLLMEVSRARAAETFRRLTDKAPVRWWAMAVENLKELGRRDELAVLLEQLIGRGDVGDADRESMAYALIDSAGAERALPVIARLADSVGGAWDTLYRENLTKLGRRGQLRAYLAARAARNDLSVADRRALAFALLELKDKKAAVQVLLRLADAGGSDGEDVKQLYFLWGPRPPQDALAWMEKRARAATGPARAGWYDKLVEMGAGDRVLAMVAPTGAVPDDPSLLGIYIETKAAKQDAGAVAQAVIKAAKDERRPELLRRYARLAEQVRRSDAAAVAWGALASILPDDAEALRQSGLAAFDANRPAEAERLLRRYLGRDPDDYEAWYFMGEALVVQKRGGDAAPFFRTALSQLRGQRNLPESARQTEAGILNRLGQVDEAIAIYRDLRRLRPLDRRLQADFANMLIENRRLEEAQHVLAAR